MLTSWQTQPVAFMNMEDGTIVSLESPTGRDIDERALDDVRDKGRSPIGWWDAVIEVTDGEWEPLIRYQVHEMESANWDDLEYSRFGDFAPDAINYERETVDVSSVIGVFCDETGERIE